MYRVGLALLRVFMPTLTWAKTFHCSAGDVSCLIASITQANANGKENTILLESGVDTLTVVDNTTEGTNGLPSITSPLTLKGKGAVNTIIERDSGGPGFRIFYVAAEGALKLQGMTVRGGQVVVSSQGSGILNDGVLIITDSIISEHMLLSPSGLGAGIASHNILTIDRSIITRNSTDGPGICGGIAASGIMTITKSTISFNGAEFGGALCTVGQASIAESAIIGNGGLGEGIFNGGTLTITNTTIAFNAAEFRTIRSTNSLTILNSTIVENRGGMVTESPSGGNSVVTLQNTILAHNSPFGFSICGGPLTSLGNNLIDDPTPCTITLQPTDLIGDPGLNTFTDDGTPGNGHFPLLPTSRAIDAGNKNACPKKDQIGEKRHSPCDIGAIEFPDEP